MSRSPGAAHGDTDPHGAVWCTEHNHGPGSAGRWECSKNSKRSGERCHDVAIVGRHACKTHIGESTAVAVAKGKANVAAYEQHAAWSSVEAGKRPALDPSTVVMQQLALMVLRADLLGELLRLQMAADGEHGLVGATFAAGREGMRVETGEAVRSLARLESAARDQVVKYAKTAHDMGIDERNLEIEQARAQRVTVSLVASLDAVWALLVDQLPADAQVSMSAVVRQVGVDTFLEGIGRGDGDVRDDAEVAR